MRTIHIPVGVIKAYLVLMAAIGAVLLASTVTLPIMGSGVWISQYSHDEEKCTSRSFLNRV